MDREKQSREGKPQRTPEMENGKKRSSAVSEKRIRKTELAINLACVLQGTELSVGAFLVFSVCNLWVSLRSCLRCNFRLERVWLSTTTVSMKYGLMCVM